MICLAAGRKLLPAVRLLPIRAANRPPPHPDLRPLDPRGDALVVQLLAGAGRDPGPSRAPRHQYAHPRHDVHGPQERHSTGRLRESKSPPPPPAPS
jgi:hypothetical protein